MTERQTRYLVAVGLGMATPLILARMGEPAGEMAPWDWFVLGVATGGGVERWEAMTPGERDDLLAQGVAAGVPEGMTHLPPHELFAAAARDALGGPHRPSAARLGGAPEPRGEG